VAGAYRPFFPPVHLASGCPLGANHFAGRVDDELGAILDRCIERGKRNATIEEWLWDVPVLGPLPESAGLSGSVLHQLDAEL